MRVSSRARILALGGYALIILWATLQGIAPDPEATRVLARLARALHPSPGAKDVVDGVRNLALFAGLGTLWVAVSPTTTLRQTLGRPLVAGAALSLFVESIQLFSRTRTASILDLVTNTVGAGIGAVLVVVLAGVARRLRHRKSFVGVPAPIVLAGFAGAGFLHEVILVRPDAVVGAAGGPMRRIAAVVASPDFATLGPILLGDLLLMFPLGAVAVAALVELGAGYRIAALRTAIGAVGFALLGELVRAPLGLPVQLAPIVTHAAAIAAGGWAVAHWLPRLTGSIRGRARARVAAGGYAAFVALWAWRPYVPEIRLSAVLEQLSLTRLIPLGALAPRMDLYSVADVVAPFCLCLPLGAFLAVWPAKRSGAWVGCLPGIYLAAATELGQVLVAGRFFSGTDIAVQAAAVAIGWIIMRRVGYRPYGALLSAA